MRPPLDPGFFSEAEFIRQYQNAVQASQSRQLVVIGLERDSGERTRFETEIIPGHHQSSRYLQRLVKFLLWSRGGRRLLLGGASEVMEPVASQFRSGGAREFDVNLMQRAYNRRFELSVCDAMEVPAANEQPRALGGNTDGCRIGFDLGASDFKIAAVHDGEVVYSNEFPWNPRVESDPAYHWNHLQSGLEAAAKALPRVDAIGGSSAGVIVNNEIRVASLFRSVAEPVFDQDVRGMFLRLAEHWKVPVEVVNDGEVTALAGAMGLGIKGLLGIALGSSEAAGYIDRSGHLTGWLNELAFAPLDASPDAQCDEWSGDRGVGALYLSQQAVNRLLPAAGIEAEPAIGLPERLKLVQKLMEDGDPRAAAVFQSIGVYLAHAVLLYSAYYDCDHMLVLGRVTSGGGGEMIVSTCRQVLASEAPAVAERMRIHVPDERTRRVGQAVAAASLPEITK